MTRGPKRAKVARKASRKRASARKALTRTVHDPLNDFIVAGARALDLSIEPPWMAAVHGNLKVILSHGLKVASFKLPDEAEPAPVFEA